MTCSRKCITPRLATLCAALDDLGMSGLVFAALHRRTDASHQAVCLEVATPLGEEPSAASGIAMTTQHRDSVAPIGASSAQSVKMTWCVFWVCSLKLTC